MTGVIAITCAVAATAGCGAAASTSASASVSGAAGSAAQLDSGIRGHVLYGPTCPVQRPGQQCFRPYQATIAIRRIPSNALAVRVQSAADGSFTARLRPGRYMLVPASRGPRPSAQLQTVRVRRHRFARVTITYDSGIR